MEMIAWLIIGLVIVQGIMNIHLINALEKTYEDNDKYYASLRRDFDIRLEEKQKDIEVRDEIIEGLRCKYGE